MTADGDEQATPYSVRSEFAETGVWCSPRVRCALSDLTQPYFAIEPEPAPQGWQVIVGGVPPGTAVNRTVAAHGEGPVEYAIDEGSRRIYHMAPDDKAWIVQSLLRNTRAIHRSAAQRRGVVLVSGALVRVNGLGVGLLGSRRAGKTSLIMASVLNGQGQLVCNDGVGMVADHSGVVSGVGWPSSISVRLDTLDLLFGRARSREIQSTLTHPANQTLSRLVENGDEPEGNALFYPAEYSRVVGTGIAHRSSVDVIVYPALANPGEEARLEALSVGGRHAVPSGMVLIEPNKHLNIFGGKPDEDRARRTLEAVADLPAFSFRYGFDQVRSAADELADFLGRAVGGAA